MTFSISKTLVVSEDLLKFTEQSWDKKGVLLSISYKHTEEIQSH